MDKGINWQAVGVIIAGVGLIAGILAWWMSKFLSDKRDIITCKIKIEELDRRMNNAEGDIKTIILKGH